MPLLIPGNAFRHMQEPIAKRGVVREEAVGDEVVGAIHLDVVDRLDPSRFNGDDRVPCHIRTNVS